MKKATLLSLLATVISLPAFAEEAATAAVSASGDLGSYALAAGLAIGVAALGGALGQGKIGAAAMDGIARNPQARKDMFVPMILGLVLIESLVIYAFVIAFMVIGKM